MLPDEKEKGLSIESAEWVRWTAPLLSCSLEKPLYTWRLFANAARSCSRRAESFSRADIARALQASTSGLCASRKIKTVKCGSPDEQRLHTMVFDCHAKSGLPSCTLAEKLACMRQVQHSSCRALSQMLEAAAAKCQNAPAGHVLCSL